MYCISLLFIRFAGTWVVNEHSEQIFGSLPRIAKNYCIIRWKWLGRSSQSNSSKLSHSWRLTIRVGYEVKALCHCIKILAVTAGIVQYLYGKPEYNLEERRLCLEKTYMTQKGWRAAKIFIMLVIKKKRDSPGPRRPCRTRENEKKTA